jgi:hypothetical protein
LHCSAAHLQTGLVPIAVVEFCTHFVLPFEQLFGCGGLHIPWTRSMSVRVHARVQVLVLVGRMQARMMLLLLVSVGVRG